MNFCIFCQSFQCQQFHYPTAIAQHPCFKPTYYTPPYVSSSHRERLMLRKRELERELKEINELISKKEAE